MRADVMLERVNFTASFRTQADRVVVAFTTRNDSDADIYLIDHAFAVEGGAAVVRRDHLVVTYEDGGVAVLASRLRPLDASIRWVTPPKIYATRVRPGTHYAREVSALLPLRPQSWRTPRNEQGEILTEQISVGHCSRLRFELGMIAGDAGADVPSIEMAGVDVVRLRPEAVRRQVVLDVEQALSVPCVDMVAVRSPTSP